MNGSRLKPNEWEPPIIAVIGMGTGDLSCLARQWIEAATILVGSRRQLEVFPDHAGKKICLKSPLAGQIEELGKISQLERTAILASGDPLFLGIGKTLASAFGKERLFVIPNVTSVQALCARLCEPWDAIGTVSFHGRRDDRAVGELFDGLNRGRKVAVLTDPAHTPNWIARELFRSGRASCRLDVGEDLGSPLEKIRSFGSCEFIEESFSDTNVVLVSPPEHEIEKAEMTSGQVFGFSEEEFEREAGMITKMEVRAVALALLQLAPGQTMWDLGAATGAVSLEAARIAPLKKIFAVEKNRSRFHKLLRNVGKFAVSEVVEGVCAGASDAIDRFPDPDRVFIGGSGDELEKILETVSNRLLPGGRVVQTVVLLKTLESVRSFWKARQFEVSVTQLQVSRSIPTGSDLRLQALNPVFIVSAWRALM